MTSAEIKKMLKPMADFAPAFIRAAEIVEAAEAAEKRNHELIKEQTQLQKTIDELTVRTTEYEQKSSAAKISLNETREYVERQKASLQKSLSESQNELTALKGQIDKAKKAEETIALAENAKVELKDLNEQIDALKAVKRQLSSEVDDLKRERQKTADEFDNWVKSLKRA